MKQKSGYTAPETKVVVLGARKGFLLSSKGLEGHEGFTQNEQGIDYIIS